MSLNKLPVFLASAVISAVIATLITACGSDGGSTVNAASPAQVNSALDNQLRPLIATLGLTGDPSAGRTLPDIEDPLSQLGKALFFSKSLGGGFDTSCASCHHPMLGGGDNLSFPVGVEALTSDLLGPGREYAEGSPVVPRNAPTIFNAGLWDTGLFWDSRVESLGKEAGENGSASGISTPDSGFGIADLNAGDNLVAAQARFPVTSVDEMKTADFETGSSNAAIRHHLAARFGNYSEGTGELASPNWLALFQAAFNSTETAENLVTFDNIVLAIAEYERSMVFVNNPWKAYVEGDNAALTDEQKSGAILFFTPPNQGGAGCSGCHSGDLFSDGRHHGIAFPQIGPGEGDGNHDDFGRERVTHNAGDRYHFRTASLLNIAVTAPYTHSGAFETLDDVVRHYVNPVASVQGFFDNGGWCQLQQFSTVVNCASLYPDAENNSQLALQKLSEERDARATAFAPIRLNPAQAGEVVAFLEALTDPCVVDRDCLDPWIADPSQSGPDGNQLQAVDVNGDFL